MATSSNGSGGHGSRGRQASEAKAALGEGVPDAALPDPEALSAAPPLAPEVSFRLRVAKNWVIMPAMVIRVRVKPNSRASLLTQSGDGSWVAHVRAPAIGGRANQELVALIAQQFHCVKAAVFIKSGACGRMKVVRVEGG